MPDRLAPQLATNVAATPDGPGWLSEIKLDGYRLLVWIEHGRVRLVTRNGHDWTNRLPRLAARFAALKLGAGLLDGELVALRPDGASHFHDLQAALSEGRDHQLFFYAFDLVHLDGWDLRAAALRDRKRLLEGLEGWSGFLRYADHVDGEAAGLLREASRLKLEGVICKRADAPYRPGRSAAWLKVKCLGREEFVVLGWTPPGGAREGLGALAIGFYDAEGRLHFAGAVGTGFSDHDLIDLRARLGRMPLQRPVLQLAGEAPDLAIRWVPPELVAEVSFTAWSGEGRVRHAVFHGLREDKDARDVVMAPPDANAPRREVKPRATVTVRAPAKSRWRGAVPPVAAVKPGKAPDAPAEAPLQRRAG